jgi:hypothetical protein
MLLQIAKLGGEAAFTPEDISILVAAFNSAWGQVQASGEQFSASDDQERARTVIAKSIIDAATQGERDPRVLANRALMQLSKTGLCRS